MVTIFYYSKMVTKFALPTSGLLPLSSVPKGGLLSKYLAHVVELRSKSKSQEKKIKKHNLYSFSLTD